jgi:hypothetical protein
MSSSTIALAISGFLSKKVARLANSALRAEFIFSGAIFTSSFVDVTGQAAPILASGEATMYRQE